MNNKQSKTRTNVLYYKEWAELALTMPDYMQLALFKALNRYITCKEIPETTDPSYWVFIGWKNQLDRDEEKYKAKCESQRELANRRWKSDAKACQGIPSHANDADKDNDKDKEDDNDDEDEKDKDKEREERLYENKKFLSLSDLDKEWLLCFYRKKPNMYELFKHNPLSINHDIYMNLCNQYGRETVDSKLFYIANQRCLKRDSIASTVEEFIKKDIALQSKQH